MARPLIKANGFAWNSQKKKCMGIVIVKVIDKHLIRIVLL